MTVHHVLPDRELNKYHIYLESTIKSSTVSPDKTHPVCMCNAQILEKKSTKPLPDILRHIGPSEVRN